MWGVDGISVAFCPTVTVDAYRVLAELLKSKAPARLITYLSKGPNSEALGGVLALISTVEDPFTPDVYMWNIHPAAPWKSLGG